MSSSNVKHGGNPVSYKLSNSDVLSVYQTIFQRFAQGYPASEFPRFVILGAQPGAGKSVLSTRLKNEFGNAGQPVHIDIDALREYHPLKDKILTEDLLNFGAHTHADSGLWTGFLLRDAQFIRSNILYEVSLRSPEWTKTEIDAFKTEGYAVDMHVLAVNENVSRLGIFQRFESAIEKGEIPRFVPIEFHDHSYNVLPGSVSFLENNTDLNLAIVHSRQGQRLYERRGNAGEAMAVDALIMERSRAWTNQEKTEHMMLWSDVVKKVLARSSDVLKTDKYMEVVIQSMRIAASYTGIDVPASVIEQDTKKSGFNPTGP